MTAATVEKKFARTVEQTLAKYTVRAKAFANVVATMKDTHAEPGSPAYNQLAAERAKAERYLKTATQSLTKKGWTQSGCRACTRVARCRRGSPGPFRSDGRVGGHVLAGRDPGRGRGRPRALPRNPREMRAITG
jgi:hypothetical protein